MYMGGFFDMNINCLVVTGTMEFYDFPYILGMSSSQLTSIFFQRGRAQPPSR